MNRKRHLRINFFYIIPAVLLVLLIISNKMLTVTSYNVRSDKIPENFKGFKLALIADLHNASFGKDNRILLNKLEKMEPDAVLLAGDMVSTSDKEYTVFFSLAQKLAQRYETYYVVGNHEQALGEKEVNLFCQNAESEGIKVLDNQRVSIIRGNEKINLYGMWFNLRFYADRSPEADKSQQYYFDVDTITEILGQSSKNEFNILLTHNPLYFDTYEKWGADLTLSGHIHGGMIRIPFIGGVYSPEKTYFPEYDGGIYAKNNSQMIVSRGMGNGGLGFRFLNCPELVEVVLK